MYSIGGTFLCNVKKKARKLIFTELSLYTDISIQEYGAEKIRELLLRML